MGAMALLDALAETLAWHMTDQDYECGCALRCGYDGDARNYHLAEALLARLREHVSVEV
jgi:hypothetical protein